MSRTPAKTGSGNNGNIRRRLQVVAAVFILSVCVGSAARADGSLFVTSPSQPLNVGDAIIAATAYHESGAYERDVDNKVQRLTTVLSPLIIVIMAVAVVFIVFSVLQPILDMQNFVQ